MNTYYPFLIVYIVAGLAITIGAFLWAIKNGQFKDQQRARFLPLDEEGERPVETTPGLNRPMVFLLLGLSGSGVLVLAIALVYLFMSGG